MRLRIAAKVDRADIAYFDAQIEPARAPHVEFIGEIGEAREERLPRRSHGPAVSDRLARALRPRDDRGPGRAARRSWPTTQGSVPEVLDDGVTGFSSTSVAEAVAAVGRLRRSTGPRAGGHSRSVHGRAGWRRTTCDVRGRSSRARTPGPREDPPPAHGSRPRATRRRGRESVLDSPASSRIDVGSRSSRTTTPSSSSTVPATSPPEARRAGPLPRRHPLPVSLRASPGGRPAVLLSSEVREDNAASVANLTNPDLLAERGSLTRGSVHLVRECRLGPSNSTSGSCCGVTRPSPSGCG